MGFFSASELKQVSKVKVDTSSLKSDCLQCGLYKDCDSPKMKYSGKGKKGILIIGEFSSSEEDLYGKPLVGENGDFLREKLSDHGIKFNRDCWRVNALRCIPNKFPIPAKQVQCCSPYLSKIIKKLKPKLILAMGSIATTALFSEDFSDRNIERWRSYCIPDEKYGCNIFPIHHPSQLIKEDKNKSLHCLFDRDLKKALKCLKKPFIERKEYEKRVTILTDFIKVKTLLKRILKKKKTILFDYETTGLKPFRAGHKIATIGLATSAKKAYAFPFDYKTFWTKKEFAELKRLWKKILKNKQVKKMAYNSKFEEIWSKVLIGARPNRWLFDPMMAEHVLDNRRATIGLKFQTFVRYGVRPYDKEIKKFLKSKNGEFNTIEQAPFKDLLIYNGLDCIFGWMMYEDQLPKIQKVRGLLKAYVFFMNGSRAMATAQCNGIPMDTEYYKKTKKLLEKKIRKRKNYLEQGREAKRFKKMFNRPIKITSNKDLGKLFYEVLGVPPIYTNSKEENYKTDKPTLEKLNLPFVDKLLEMKKYEKALGTYLGQFSREIYKKKMYPFFDLHIPVSYRSSSSMPNFQNLPKRDEEIKKLIRMGIVPDLGCIISEMDFSGAEVITSATYHKDPTYMHDIVKGDMHRDLAMELFMLPLKLMDKTLSKWDKKQIAAIKKIRFFSKNMWTFAQFYGDWFAPCAKNLWETVVEGNLKLPNGMKVKRWLEKKGIYELGEMEDGQPTEGSFLEHCKEVETKMWNERYPLYTQWKKDIVSYYQEYGYIENHFGFRFVSNMNKNQCTNFPIQSASFHLLVYTLIEVNKFIKKNKLKTRVIGQVHDSILANIPKNEIEIYTKGVSNIVKGLKDHFDWLIIPMEIEIELSKLRENGGNFAELREYTLKEIQNGEHLNFI